MDVKCAQCYSTVVAVTHFSKKAQSDQFPDKFLFKKEYSGYAIISAEAAKRLQIFQNRCRCSIQQLSFEVIQMVLGKNPGMAGQGSGEVSCEHTAAPGCRGHEHSANSSRQGKHWAAADQNCNCSGGSTQSSGGYTREMCSCDEGTEESLPTQQKSQITLHPLLLTKRNKNCFLWKI